ncbi:fumarate reductase [Saccharomycopsis crataegensis]|uniref:Fumarate reductase n=1 Tax=Saccharomycopsis crataegensis TaxID=43959 RepID=A0AAV5QTD9_9ASCO|nr:fumarate reductase [Saccharomycopsis crataegensis]
MATPVTIASAKPALVVGSGLAGLTAAHELLNKYNLSVMLFEKTPKLGGNSIKASSGINGVNTPQQIAVLKNLEKTHQSKKDSVELFMKDTIKSASQGVLVGPRKDLLSVFEKSRSTELSNFYNEKLIETLTNNSKDAIGWLTDELELKLNKVSQLGGHSVARTHRGENLPPGFEIISTLQKSLQKFIGKEKSPRLEIVTDARVVELVKQKKSTGIDEIVGLKYKVGDNGEITKVTGPVILATGGFAADFSGESSLLAKYRPDCLQLPSTNGQQSTGDGHKLVQAIGGELMGMQEIQIHPTGFINPKDPDSKWKILAGEALRGTGGLLFDSRGKRFINELRTRDKVSSAIFDIYEKHPTDKQQIVIIMNESGYQEMRMNFDFYMKVGLIQKTSVDEVASKVFNIPHQRLLDELTTVNKYINGEEQDPLGRTVFSKEPFDLSKGADSEIYYGLITPVIHFTMGGVKIDDHARVMSESGNAFEGLYAAGEVTSGVHGKNRLGGSSLLECVVFGKIAAEELSKNLR